MQLTFLEKASSSSKNIGIRFAEYARNHQDFLYKCLLVILLAILALIQTRTLYLPLDRDEGEFALMGQQILDGVTPYSETYTMKLPGSALLYSIAMSLFGASIPGIHFGLIVVRFLASLMIFAVARRFIGKLSSLISAISYSILSASVGVMGTAFYPEQAIALLFLSGLYLILTTEGQEDKQKARYYLRYVFAGISFSFALLIKQHALFLIPVGFFALYYKHTHRPFKMLFKPALAFVLGLLLPVLIVAAYFFYSKAWDAFVFWCFTYSTAYVTFTSFMDGFGEFFFKTIDVVRNTEILWLFGISGFIYAIVTRKSERLLLSGALLFSFLAIVPGYYFRDHYFIFLLPCIALGIGFLHGSFWDTDKYRSDAVKIIFSSLLITGLFSGIQFYISGYSIKERLAIIYPTEAATFYQTHLVSQCVTKQIKEGDRILVLGNEPEVFFYTKAKNASKFIYTIEVFRPTKWRTRLQDEFLQDMEKEEPRFIMIVPPLIYLNTSEDFTKRIDAFLIKHYEKASIEFTNQCKKDFPEYNPEQFSVIVLENTGKS